MLVKSEESDIIKGIKRKEGVGMSEREKAYQLLDIVPEYKIGYVVSYLQGVTDGETVRPNKDTLEAFEELESGGGECFNTLEELWTSLEE